MLNDKHQLFSMPQNHEQEEVTRSCWISSGIFYFLKCCIVALTLTGYAHTLNTVGVG